jgi:platelet-activating factor acetylhydrolase IB subunit alpha
VANLPQSASAIRQELGESITLDDATIKKYEGLLEKKWTSVVRLQKRVGCHPITEAKGPD